MESTKPEPIIDEHKLFVGGLSRDIDCVLAKGKESGQSLRFGFITFKESETAKVALQNGPHIIDHKTIYPEPCKKKIPEILLRGLPPTEVAMVYNEEKKNAVIAYPTLSFSKKR